MLVAIIVLQALTAFLIFGLSVRLERLEKQLPAPVHIKIDEAALLGALSETKRRAGIAP